MKITGEGILLAGRDADDVAAHGLTNAEKTLNIVACGRLLDPVRPELGQDLHPGDRLVDSPDLVGIGHQVTVLADDLAELGEPPAVVVEIEPDLGLEVSKAAPLQILDPGAHLGVAQAEPARGRIGERTFA